MMSLDRIDNKVGHLKTNVVAACIRCNYFRRDMPFAAWKIIVPAMRKARKMGVLKGWNCGIHSRHFEYSGNEPVGLLG